MPKKRVAQLVLLVAALAVFLVLQRSWPRDQSVHVVLGDAAPRVRELEVRYGEGSLDEATIARGGEDVWSRSVAFQYGAGEAPRVMTHTTRLANGEWTLRIDIGTATEKRTISRRVTLTGGITSIDVSEAVPK